MQVTTRSKFEPLLKCKTKLALSHVRLIRLKDSDSLNIEPDKSIWTKSFS